MLGIRIRHSCQTPNLRSGPSLIGRAPPRWGIIFHPNIPTERYQRDHKDAALQGFRASERPGLLPSSHPQPFSLLHRLKKRACNRLTFVWGTPIISS
jgi:hypothetical protein